MSKKLMVLLVLIFATTSCLAAPKAPEKSLPTKLIEQTVSLVGFNGGEWGTYCTGVWVDDKTILTAYHCAAAAKVMSLSEDEQEEADEQGQKLNAIGAPVYYSVKESFNNVLTNGPMNFTNAIVVFGDSEHDIALIETVGFPPNHRNATLVEFEPAIGEEILLMGHPAGIEYTFAHGYVSAYRSDINQDVIDIHGPFMQINAAISGGNSGGGVFTSNGELCGIVSFVTRRMNGQGFTVPASSIKRLLEEYSKNKK